MEIKQIHDSAEWEAFVQGQSYSLFVQSGHYGDFYEAMGERSWRFGIYTGEKLIGGSLVVSTHARRGSFLYLPYGPILPDENQNQALAALTATLKKFARGEYYDFIRVSPFLDETETNKQLFLAAGFRSAPMHMLAETTWLLAIEPSEDRLLAAMNKNHRNLIRRCLRAGARVKAQTGLTASAGQTAVAEFNQLHDTTAARHKFHRFSARYIEQEFRAFASHGEAVIFHGYLPDGRLDSSALVVYYGNMACYRHGASLNLDKQLPTSYLVQWEAIREAKRRGAEWYNFWGIAPRAASPRHPFYGLTHFKTGFGGFEKDLLRCQDLPITRAYWKNWLIESIRRRQRGF